MIKWLLILFSLSVFAREKITLGTFNIPEFVTSKDSGAFVDLVREIGNRLDLDIEIVLRPPRRTLSSFASEQLDGYFPALDGFNQNLKTSDTTPFYYKKDFFFSYEEVKNLKGKTVCLTAGYPYEKSLLENKELNLIYTHSDQTCLQMLIKKRADFFVCELHSGVAALRDSGIREIHIFPQAISKLDVFFSFQDSIKGRRLSKLFSAEINRMRKDKKLSNFFEKSTKYVSEYVKFGYDPTIK
ncbi:ABC transporter substrate-binding protein [Bacteriovorax sp. Seq25_V]|uniref:substrate-binding periplasmic protein n=1 Tax=Bacteriovorax sp. Seq25_V TaxID=1201288 RepID=UPI00038A29C6|nr:transporter substrate-binding domain-containing protein [Bacteriovorax sp. Seq25_V]EQC45321.1 ABC transporter, substrate-binding protein, family 3 [Bacteriovorax sp. Seq25_V]